MTKIDVLDKGYVRLLDSMGDDLKVVNAARVSYDRRSMHMEVRDEKLLNFLVRENHTAPFRHSILTLEVYAPLMVKNQWFKHLIGGIYDNDAEFAGLDPFFAWNESSRRYITEEEQFYVPDITKWRSKPANSKQGSGEALPAYVDDLNNLQSAGDYWTHEMRFIIHQGVVRYQKAMAAGVAPEQARLFLPAYAMYVRWQWTTSLHGMIHFLGLRNKPDAQWEIREFARAAHELTRIPFPATVAAVEASQGV